MGSSIKPSPRTGKVPEGRMRSPRQRPSFLARLRIAWRILWAKAPVFTEPPTEIVNAAHTVSPKLSPYRLSVQWWCPLEREAWAREHLARELAGDAEQFVRFIVDKDEETQSCTVRGELWVLTEAQEEHHAL